MVFPSGNKRRRGTAIVESDQGILVMIEGQGKHIILPGGQARLGETRLQAAVRELREETGLYASFIVPLFRYNSTGNAHTVYHIRANGAPRREHGVKYLAYYSNQALTLITCRRGYESVAPSRMSRSTLEIIDLYYRYREEHRALFESIDAYNSLGVRTYP